MSRRFGLLIAVLIGIFAPCYSSSTVMPPITEDPPPPPPSSGTTGQNPTANPTLAPASYCSSRARPADNEIHYRFSIPYPDPAYSANELLKLPSTPGEINITVNPGKTYVYKFRFRSDLLKFPEKTKTNYYRIPGFEDKYPDYAGWICNGDTSGIQAPINGVSVMLWKGDGGGSSLAGYSPIYNQGMIPPFNATSSGVYGFTYTPTLSQVGKTMEIRVVTQTGVTANERDYQNTYESDQGVYKVFIHVEQAPIPSMFYTQWADGLYGNIKLSSIFSSAPRNYVYGVLTPPPTVDDVIRVEYYVDNVLKTSVVPFKQSVGGDTLFTSDYTVASQYYSDGSHQFNVVGYARSGRILPSSQYVFNVMNTVTIGPAPNIGLSRDGLRPVVAVWSSVTGISIIRAEFYKGDGSYIGLGGVYNTRSPNDLGIYAPTTPGDYTYYVVVYYSDGSKGISSVLNYSVPVG